MYERNKNILINLINKNIYTSANAYCHMTLSVEQEPDDNFSVQQATPRVFLCQTSV